MFSQLQGSTAKEADPHKEHSRPEKSSVHAKRSSFVASLRHKKQASSVEAEITGSAVAAPRLPKQEASTASSRKCTFKEGLCFCFLSCHFFCLDLLIFLYLPVHHQALGSFLHNDAFFIL